jgi:uncharacterized protein (TIGR02118 family)
MEICWFATFAAQKPVDAAEIAALSRFLAGLPGVGRSLVHTPTVTNDPYLDDGPPPTLVLQVYWPEIAAMEAALARDGALQALATPAILPSQTGASVTQQAMLVRNFPVPDARFHTPAGEPHCTYLVSYEGPAEDLNVWLDHYIHHHPPIMARFPGIRQIEITSRIDWCGFLPWPRIDYIQRNKVVFDDQAALTAALNSPVRHEMRADFKEFPPFAGGNTHYPMLTRVVNPS